MRMRKLRRRPSNATAIAFLALIAASSGVAIGAIPGADGTIHGCYPANGALRVVDEAATCSAGETRITWNQHGVPGPAGPAGGISQAWLAGPVLRSTTITSRTVYSKLRSLDLPAGSYAIDGRSNLRLKDGVEDLGPKGRGPANMRAAVADCRLRTRPTGKPDATPVDIEIGTAITNSHGRAFTTRGEAYHTGDDVHLQLYTRRNEVPLSLHTAVTLREATTVSLECRTDYGGREPSSKSAAVRPSVEASVPSIRALAVGQVNLVP